MSNEQMYSQLNPCDCRQALSSAPVISTFPPVVVPPLIGPGPITPWGQPYGQPWVGPGPYTPGPWGLGPQPYPYPYSQPLLQPIPTPAVPREEAWFNTEWNAFEAYEENTDQGTAPELWEARPAPGQGSSHGSGHGSGHGPGHGPGPWGPGHGPGPWGPGHGPGPWGPGHGPGPWGPGPWGPGPWGPGPWGPGPWGPGPWGPGPWGVGPVIPLPLPIPIGGPRDQHLYVNINGGTAYPNATASYRLNYQPGITIYDALNNTGIIQLSPQGQILAVSGVGIGEIVNCSLSINGRSISDSMLGHQLQPNEHIDIELIYA